MPDACRYFNSAGGCARGETCKFEHVPSKPKPNGNINSTKTKPADKKPTARKEAATNGDSILTKTKKTTDKKPTTREEAATEVCRYFNSASGCRRANCWYQHLEQADGAGSVNDKRSGQMKKGLNQEKVDKITEGISGIELHQKHNKNVTAAEGTGGIEVLTKHSQYENGTKDALVVTDEFTPEEFQLLLCHGYKPRTDDLEEMHDFLDKVAGSKRSSPKNGCEDYMGFSKKDWYLLRSLGFKPWQEDTRKMQQFLKKMSASDSSDLPWSRQEATSVPSPDAKGNPVGKVVGENRTVDGAVIVSEDDGDKHDKSPKKKKKNKKNKKKKVLVDVDFEDDDRFHTMGFINDDWHTLLSWGFKPWEEEWQDMYDFLEMYNSGEPMPAVIEFPLKKH